MSGSKQDWSGFRKPQPLTAAPEPNQDPQNQVPCIHCGCGAFIKGFEIFRSTNPLAIGQTVITVKESFICIACHEPTDVKNSPTLGEMEAVSEGIADQRNSLAEMEASGFLKGNNKE